MTQTTLAKKLNVARTYLSAIENCRQMPSMPMLYAIAQELNVPPAILLVGSSDHNKVEKLLYQAFCEIIK